MRVREIALPESRAKPRQPSKKRQCDQLTTFCSSLYPRFQEAVTQPLEDFANAECRSNPPLSVLLLQPHAGVSMSESN